MVDKIIGSLKQDIIEGEVKKGEIGVNLIESAKSEIEVEIKKITADLNAALNAIPENHEKRKEIEKCINEATCLVEEKWKEFQNTISDLLEEVEDADLDKRAASKINGAGGLGKSYKKAKRVLKNASEIGASVDDGGVKIVGKIDQNELKKRKTKKASVNASEIKIDKTIEDTINKAKKTMEGIEGDISAYKKMSKTALEKEDKDKTRKDKIVVKYESFIDSKVKELSDVQAEELDLSDIKEVKRKFKKLENIKKSFEAFFHVIDISFEVSGVSNEARKKIKDKGENRKEVVDRINKKLEEAREIENGVSPEEDIKTVKEKFKKVTEIKNYIKNEEYLKDFEEEKDDEEIEDVEVKTETEVPEDNSQEDSPESEDVETGTEKEEDEEPEEASQEDIDNLMNASADNDGEIEREENAEDKTGGGEENLEGISQEDVNNLMNSKPVKDEEKIEGDAGNIEGEDEEEKATLEKGVDKLEFESKTGEATSIKNLKEIVTRVCGGGVVVMNRVERSASDINKQIDTCVEDSGNIRLFKDTWNKGMAAKIKELIKSDVEKIKNITESIKNVRELYDASIAEFESLEEIKIEGDVMIPVAKIDEYRKFRDNLYNGLSANGFGLFDVDDFVDDKEKEEYLKLKEGANAIFEKINKVILDSKKHNGEVQEHIDEMSDGIKGLGEKIDEKEKEIDGRKLDSEVRDTQLENIKTRNAIAGLLNSQVIMLNEMKRVMGSEAEAGVDGQIKSINNMIGVQKKLIRKIMDKLGNGEDEKKVDEDKSDTPVEGETGIEGEDEKDVVSEKLNELGISLSMNDIGADKNLECSLVENEIDITEDAKEEMKRLLLEYGILDNAESEEGVEILDSYYNNIKQNMSDALDAEAQNEFSKWRYHKKTIAAGIGVGAVAAIASAGIRMVGGGMVANAAIVGGTALGAGSGLLRGKVRQWLSPAMEKLKKNNSKKFDKARVKESKKVLTSGNLKLMMLQTLRAGIAKKVMNKEDFSEEDYKENIKEYFDANLVEGELPEEEKEKMINAVTVFAKISNENSRKLEDVIESKGGKLFSNDVVKGTVAGGVLGGATAAARSMSDTAFSTVAGGATGGIIGGAMMSGRIEEMMKNKDVKKIINEVSDIIDAGEKREEGFSDNELLWVKSCLESGVLDKNALVKEKAKKILIDNLLRVESNEKNYTTNNEEVLRKKIGEGKFRKLKAWSVGVGGGLLLGGAAAYLANEAADMLKDGKLFDVNAETAAAKYGVTEESLKLSDVNNDNEYDLEEIAAAQSIELGYDGEKRLEKPLLKTEFEKLKNDIAQENQGIIDEGKQMILDERKIDLDNQEKKYGVKFTHTLNENEINTIDNYLKIPGFKNELISEKELWDITNGLTSEEIEAINEKLHDGNQKGFGVDLKEIDFHKGEKYDNSYIAGEQGKKLGLSDGALQRPVLGTVMKELDNVNKEVLAILVEDGVLNNDDLKIVESIPTTIKGNPKMIEGYVRLVSEKGFGLPPESFSEIKSGGSISEALGHNVEKSVKVINTDGGLLKDFDENLVHEGDLVFTDRSGDEVYVIKASNVKVSDGDSLSGVYDKIDTRLEEANVPDDIRDHFNEGIAKGGFHERMTTKEAGEAKAFWESLDEKHQGAWSGLDADHRQEILDKGEWVDRWETSTPEGGVQEWTYIKHGEFDLKATAIDNEGGDGVPDSVKMYCGEKQVGLEMFRDIENGESGDKFLARVREMTDKEVVDRVAKLEDIKATLGKDIDDIKEVGLNPFDNDLKGKLEFMIDHSGFLDTNEKTREFFEIIDREGVLAEKEQMKFMAIGNFSDSQEMSARAEAISFVDKNNLNISYSKALMYGDQISEFKDPVRVRAMVNILDGEHVGKNLHNVFGLDSNAIYEYDKNTGIHRLKDVNIGQAKQINILFSKDKDGIMKFGFDGPKLDNVGTSGIWRSIKPDTLFTSENINKLSKVLTGENGVTNSSLEEEIVQSEGLE